MSCWWSLTLTILQQHNLYRGVFIQHTDKSRMEMQIYSQTFTYRPCTSPTSIRWLSLCSFCCLFFFKKENSFSSLSSCPPLSQSHTLIKILFFTSLLDILSINSLTQTNTVFLSYSAWTFRRFLSELCGVFTSHGLRAEQGTDMMDLNVTDQTVFSCPQSCLAVFAPVVWLSSQEACTSWAQNFTNTEQETHPKASRLNVAHYYTSEDPTLV